MTAKSQMLVNYVPGEECRIALLHDGKLEELHAERFDNASHVGNIYLGKVQNVEAGIQAAFVDFGLGENGFLHVSDLHPRYFPGAEDDEAERVGKKTPRRERPPIQQCLKRGQEVIVQVLKEGIGTKGPTLTSYLSIPGRYLVMMPHMDNVGVSRRIEDEDTRRKMRETLDQLDLPEGFGFILRTAGFGRNKTELKRDLAYLQRLWKDMDARLKRGGKPRLLYAESDILLRCLRDVLTNDVNEVIIDDQAALNRAARFLKIVSPRSATKLFHYNTPAPIFHAYGVEEQIKSMHLREVPLPSGGSIVIDEAEALVAIDVNSGRMRDKKDAETTALKTNIEAADEICRQLKLRELGGVVIIDFIDLRKTQHRKQLEQRVNENLKRDRANTKALRISEFGIVEMTRQRMRGSHRKTHFTACPTCAGRGFVQRPGSVTAEALREVGALLSHDKVIKVELVVSPRVAGEFLSSGRHRLNRLERITGKQVQVRVSGNIGLDELQFFAYDAQGDIEIDRLPSIKPPTNLEPFAITAKGGEDWMLDPTEEAAELARLESEAELHALEEMRQKELAAAEGPIAGIDEMPDEDGEGSGKKKRRRRRRRKKKTGDGEGAQDDAPDTKPDDNADAKGDEADASDDDEQADGAPKKKRRRRRRRRGKGGSSAEGDQAADSKQEEGDSSSDDEPSDAKPKTRTTKVRSAKVEPVDDEGDAAGEAEPDGDAAPKKKRRRRSGAKKRAGSGSASTDDKPAPAASDNGKAPAAEPKPAPKPAVKKPRSLYASHRKVKPSEVPARED
ncbi:MAG: Rne/Rng family ribonuclease [Phycisphaerales bacterium]